MKKIIIVLTIIVLIFSLNKKELSEEEMIRFRIIANSNSETDQLVKRKVMKKIEKTLLNSNANNKQEEKRYLLEQLPTFEEKIKEVIGNHNFEINYGMNYFPEKKEKETIYPEGNYESLVITLGEGAGDNFWCILFPPLCLMDEDVEYKSFLKEALSKWF